MPVWVIFLFPNKWQPAKQRRAEGIPTKIFPLKTVKWMSSNRSSPTADTRTPSSSSRCSSSAHQQPDAGYWRPLRRILPSRNQSSHNHHPTWLRPEPPWTTSPRRPAALQEIPLNTYDVVQSGFASVWPAPNHGCSDTNPVFRIDSGPISDRGCCWLHRVGVKSSFLEKAKLLWLHWRSRKRASG